MLTMTDTALVPTQNCAKRRPNKSASSSRKRVTFFSRVRVLDIPSGSSLSKADKALLWYSQEDLENLCNEREDTIEWMAHSVKIPEHDDCHCTVGLLTPIENDARKVTRMTATYEVLNAQAQQWEDDIEDPDLIAIVYFECTKHSQRLAIARARRLACEVHELCNNPPVKESTITRKIYSISRRNSHPVIPPASGGIGVEKYDIDPRRITHSSYLSEAMQIVLEKCAT